MSDKLSFRMADTTSEEWKKMSKQSLEERREALDAMPWKEAILKYPDGSERATAYKIYDTYVCLYGVEGLSTYEYQDLQTQAREWDKRKQVELNKARELAEAMAPKTIPGYIKHLIDNGFIYSDGKRCIKSLDEVAIAISNKLSCKITINLLKETFLQSNGKPYSDSACRKAVEKANVT